jgi:membrane-bound metal-dependent hydrolase YbcI (DUF457 family)
LRQEIATVHPYRSWPFLSDPHHPVLSAAWAVAIHGLISILVVLPILLASRRRLLWTALAFLSGPALDLDHVVAAVSVNPSSLEHLGHRPETHSLLFAVALALLCLAITRKIILAWSAFAVVVAHLLFDTAGGSDYILYPLKSPDAIAWLAFPVGTALLLGVSWLLVRDRGSSLASTPQYVISHRSR